MSRRIYPLFVDGAVEVDSLTFDLYIRLPKAALGDLFLQRWHVELDWRNIKTTLSLETLSCKTPEVCEKEMWVYMLARTT